MRAETTNGSIIPVDRVSVKKVMSGLLDGLPLASTDYAVTLCPSITSEEFAVGLQRLEFVEKQVVNRSRLKRGDMWNQIHLREFMVVRTAWLMSVKLRIPDPEQRTKYLRTLSLYGQVAKKWPAAVRSDKMCWTRYRSTGPDDVPAQPAEEALPFFTSLNTVIDAGDVRLEFGGYADKRIMGRITADHLEVIRKAMGWQVVK